MSLNNTTYNNSIICNHSNYFEGKNKFCKFCGSIITESNDIGLKMNNKKLKINPNNIYKKLISKHQLNRYYNQNYYHENCRIILIKKIISISNELNYSKMTSYLAINYLDSIMSRCHFETEFYNLIVLICISLSSKINELNGNSLNEKEIYLNLNRKISFETIQKYQNLILNLLNLDLNLALPLDFLNFYFKHGVIFQSEMKYLYNNSDKETNYNDFKSFILNKIKYLAEFILEKTTWFYEFYKYSSLAVASSCIAIARVWIGLKSWNTNLENLTYIKFEHLNECFNSVSRILKVNDNTSFKNNSLNQKELQSLKTIDTLKFYD